MTHSHKTTQELSADIVVIGSGFGGCLTALILQQIGRSVIVVDRAAHPRFAIGESSTPMADLILDDLAERYSLPQFKPLCKYGSWKQAHPEITCGPKRGFSYFRHEKNRPFVSNEQHSNEFLVTASRSEDVADTHWYRKDVDAFFAKEVVAAGIPLLENTEISSVQPDEKEWDILATREQTPLRIRTQFVIDASGEGRVLQSALGIPNNPSPLQTHSRALFSHFRNVSPWETELKKLGINISDHPFPCDHSAVHHVLKTGWMWQLPFDNGITSAGYALNAHLHPLNESLSPEAEWQQILDQFPSLAAQFANAVMVDPPAQVIRTKPLQRLVNQTASSSWAMLPHTAGFVDPLHSTGIAHTLHCIEFLAYILERHWNQTDLAEQFSKYDSALQSEIRMIDRLVSCCYSALPHFPIFTACTMLYFAAATTSEQRRIQYRHKSNSRPEFVLANDQAFLQVVEDIQQRVTVLSRTESVTQNESLLFEKELAETLAPFNTVGLCDPAAKNMYRYTIAEK